MAMLCYVLAALCLVYCVGVVATKAAGTKFYLIWLAGTALFGLLGFCVQKGLWMRLPIGLRAGIGVFAGVGIACLCGLLILHFQFLLRYTDRFFRPLKSCAFSLGSLLYSL